MEKGKLDDNIKRVLQLAKKTLVQSKYLCYLARPRFLLFCLRSSVAATLCEIITVLAYIMRLYSMDSGSLLCDALGQTTI